MFNKSMMKGKAGVTKPPRPNIGRKHTTDKVKQQVYVHWHKNKLKEKMPGQPLGIEPKACISYMYVYYVYSSPSPRRLTLLFQCVALTAVGEVFIPH